MPALTAACAILILLVTACSSGRSEANPNQSIDLVCGPIELQRPFEDVFRSAKNNPIQAANFEKAGVTVSLQHIEQFHPCERGSSSMRSLVNDHYAKIIIDTQHFKETLNHTLPKCEPHTLKNKGVLVLITYIVETDISGKISQKCIERIRDSLKILQ